MSLSGRGWQPLQHRGDAAPERRRVAVLFVDLAGYTSLTAELGAEDTRTLLNHFFATIDTVAERHGGTIVQHVGDCAMALFGAPVARGDDVRRSLRAALAMLGAMPELSAQVGRELQVHIGVTVGDVVAGGAGSEAHRAYAVTGECVNLAARLADLAGPGELLVSDSIRLAIGSAGRFEDRGEHQLQGIAGAVQVYRLLALGDPEDTGSFVGRGAELAQLTMLLARTERTWRGELVLVRGEAGIGKTRLLRELQRRAEEAGVACHAALVLDFGSGEGSDVVRVLTRKLLGVEGGGPEAREQVAVAAAAAGITDNRLGPFLLDLLDLPLAPEDRRVVDAMAEGERRLARQDTFAAALACAAADQPLLLLVEDVHWAEPGTLDDLAATATVIADLPVLLVVTTRHEGDPIDAAWLARVATVPTTTLDLHPLRAADARVLAGQLLLGANGQAVERCVARAQGNPLFLEQLLRHVRERSDDALPATVQTLMQARIDRLAPSDREALRAASVFGQGFTLPALRAVLGESRYEPRQLVQRLLIRPAGGSFLFAHALIRDAVYDLLMRAQRRELHGRAARFFAGQDAGLYAQHLDPAADPAAAGAYAIAARQQADAYHNEAALELATRGLEIATDSANRFALACLIGQLQLELGRVEAAHGAFASAFELADDLGERCQVLLGLAAAARLSDQLDEALACLDEAERIADGLGLAAELSRIHHLHGNILFSLGRPQDCAREHEAALQHARAAASPELEARALGGLGDAEYARGRMTSANAAFVRCCELARQHGFGRIEAANLPMVPVTSYYSLDLPRVDREVTEAIELATRVGHHRGMLVARLAAWLGALLAGDLAEASAHGREAEALTARVGAQRFAAEILLYRAEGGMLAGDRARAADLAAQAMLICRETAIDLLGPAVLGMVAWSAINREACAAAIAEAEVLLEAGSVSHNPFMFRRYAIAAALALGNWAEVDRQADALEVYAAAEPMRWTTFFVARAKALANHGRAPADAECRQALLTVRDTAAKLGLWSVLPPIEAALTR